MFVAVKTAFLSVLLLVLTSTIVTAQFCSSGCPPLNDINLPIPSLCVGNDTSAYTSKSYDVCHPYDTPFSNVRLADFKGKIVVLSNFYVGCNAGRREAGVFAHVAQRYYDTYRDKIVFVSSLKGGSSCGNWASMYQNDARRLYPESDVTPTDMPLTISDNNYEIRDDYFTTPFGHPSYVVMDANQIIRDKFIGPCCGYETMADCTPDIARSLDTMLSESIDALLVDDEETEPTPSETTTTVPPTPAPVDSQLPQPSTCIFGAFSDWSSCSLSCDSGVNGTQFRWRIVIQGQIDNCPSAVETRPCTPTVACAQECIPEFGSSFTVETVSTGFDSPRDVAFSPSPGLHLGSYSEGRRFEPNQGEEAWVVNGANHSVSIVASLGSVNQTTISRRDRGYYHYLINATALSFNSVSNSNRDADKDSFNYWAVCNDNLNTYLDTKEPNYFMGPTLYNSDPTGGNTVNRLGGECSPGEPCFFLHADMLHETPACIGIVHDPETVTAFGTVYWVFDSTGDRTTGHLVRYDFQQPHGPGSMDHSVAAVRRFPDIKLERGPPGVHAGMVVHPTDRDVYVVSPGAGTILIVGADSGSFARTAREEYPIFSNRLPSFEYSIYECPEQRTFASGLDTPTGLALSPDGETLFVAEHFSGKIHVFEVASGSLLDTIQTEFRSIGGMTFSPGSQLLHFVDADTNTLAAIKPTVNCTTRWQSRVSPDFVSDVASAQAALGDSFSLFHDLSCTVNPAVPNASLFEQVHDDSGYASNDTNVQSMAGMDPTAALLANRTDCGYDSELNFDALLLGGYYCHVCLPVNDGAMCDAGGECRNVQWLGYVCDNEFVVKVDSASGVLSLETTEGTEVDPASISLKQGVTYRFSVDEGDNITVSVYTSEAASAPPLALPGNGCGCATNGPLIITIDALLSGQAELVLRSNVANSPALALSIEEILVEPNNDKQSKGASAAQADAPTSTASGSSSALFSIVAAVLSLAVTFL